MLKKIEVGQLRVGMHLHAFDGAWISHPFWRSRFVISDPAEITRLRDSGIKSCWINVERGLDVRAPDPPAQAMYDALEEPEAPPPEPETVEAPLPPATPPRSRADAHDREMEEAAAVCKSGRAVITSVFNDARLGKAVDVVQCLPLVEEISNSVFRSPAALMSLARLKSNDDYSYLHSVAVCALMVSLSRQIGATEAESRAAGMAGLLHDVGKAFVPLAILNKPGKLSDEEFTVIKTHPERGHALLLEGQDMPAEALEVCLHHHEKFDGSGYPHRQAGESISVLARMGAVCDVYDAITSDRPYKSGWDPAESIARMASWAGHFDPAIFAAFVRGVGIYPAGSLVRLESGRLAVVVEQNPQSAAAPVVRAFFSTKTNLPIVPVRIDLALQRSDRIVGRESPDRWQFPALTDHWLDPALRKSMQ